MNQSIPHSAIRIHKLFTDGGSRGNPGDAAIGGIIFDNEKLVDFWAKYIGIETNNSAEYNALIEGLKKAIKLQIEELEVCMDSELVVKQLNGQYKVKNDEIKIFFAQIQKLKENFKTIKFTHIRRQENKFADKLVNIALDAKINEL